jgi:hypothetical protein
MKERPIIFSSDMVRAILDGRKTMTRRVVKPQPVFDSLSYSIVGPEKSKWAALVGVYLPNTNDFIHRALLNCPYGRPGDRLWCKETWAIDKKYDRFKPSKLPAREKGEIIRYEMWYAADGEAKSLSFGRTRPSIFMPRWTSRITLEITAVRVERVQDIGDEDAESEGLHWCNAASPRDKFQCLWDSLNAKRGYGWVANPFVWVIEFRRLTP